jgi:hypothetical protein
LLALHIPDEGDDALASRSDWVLLSANAELLEEPRLAEFAKPITARRDWRLWTMTSTIWCKS